jgi:hypothetical protein
MVYELYWDDDDPALVHHLYVDPVHPDDYLNLSQENAKMLSQVSHPVDIIIDVENVSGVMSNLFRTAFYVNRIMPPNQRFVVVVGASSFIRVIADSIARVVPNLSRDTYFAATHEEGREWLAQARTHQHPSGEETDN